MKEIKKEICCHIPQKVNPFDYIDNILSGSDQIAMLKMRRTLLQQEIDWQCKPERKKIPFAARYLLVNDLSKIYPR